MRGLRIGILCVLLAWTAVAADKSWQNVTAVKAGAKVEVRTAGGTIKGEFVRADQQSVTVRDKKGEHALQQSDVTRVSMAKSSRGIWIGLAAGAVGGVLVGAAAAERLSNESGGDFAGLKPAVTGAGAGAGALIGMAIGAAVRRGAVIYER